MTQMCVAVTPLARTVGHVIRSLDNVPVRTSWVVNGVTGARLATGVLHSSKASSLDACVCIHCLISVEKNNNN